MLFRSENIFNDIVVNKLKTVDPTYLSKLFYLLNLGVYLYHKKNSYTSNLKLIIKKKKNDELYSLIIIHKKKKKKKKKCNLQIIHVTFCKYIFF